MKLFKIFVEALALIAMLASVWALVFVLQFAYIKRLPIVLFFQTVKAM
jgi:hypothetical protein